MALTIAANDPQATLLTGPGTFTADQKSFISGLIRGVTDTDITALVLKEASGTICYIYPTAGGASITVSTIAP